jgi:hypothetical protein
LRLFKVRRDDLPGVDDGAGTRTELNLDADAGLAEAIHIRLFPNGVVGAEFFFHGPRITRFERFVRVKLEMPFSIRQLARHDVIEEALKYDDIRVLRVKLDPSVTSREAAGEVGLDELIIASSFEAGVYIDVQLRAEKNDDAFRERVKRLFSKLRSGNADANIFEKLEISGRPEGEHRVTQLDLLSERLYRIVEIPYRTERYRDLDSGAAFSAIREAYQQVESELPRDALG